MALFALVSAPIAGQILDSKGGMNFTSVGWYSGVSTSGKSWSDVTLNRGPIIAGSAILLACCFNIASRYSALNGWKGKF